MFIQAENAILNLNHVVEFLPCSGERTYEDQETVLRFKVQGYEYTFPKPDTDKPFMLAVMVNGNKHLVLCDAINQSSIVSNQVDNSLDKIRAEYKLGKAFN